MNPLSSDRAENGASRKLLRGWGLALPALLFALLGCAPASPPEAAEGPAPEARGRAAAEAPSAPYLVVLGVGQDGGVPQAGSWSHPGWTDPDLRSRVVSLGLVDPASGKRWLFEATPDVRGQLHDLMASPPDVRPGGIDALRGVFLTHAHIGHYTGLMFFGHESMGASGLPVYVLPRFAEFLRSGGPWDQLVRYENIELRELDHEKPVALTESLRVTPLQVPHRQEYSEVAGFLIEGPTRTALFLPDIDSWEDWDADGVRLEDVLGRVDVAYIDATFFADGEIPGRDMSGFPHPFIRHTLERLAGRQDLLEKVRFIHLNHTNPALVPGSAAQEEIASAGARVAREGEIVPLG